LTETLVLLRKYATKSFYAPRHLTSASALLCETGNTQSASFHLNGVHCFYQQTWNTLKLSHSQS